MNAIYRKLNAKQAHKNTNLLKSTANFTFFHIRWGLFRHHAMLYVARWYILVDKNILCKRCYQRTGIIVVRIHFTKRILFTLWSQLHSLSTSTNFASLATFSPNFTFFLSLFSSAMGRLKNKSHGKICYFGEYIAPINPWWWSLTN